MIMGRDFVWLHFPKTGGTATELLLHKLLGHRSDVVFDPLIKSRVIWHHSIEDRIRSDPDFKLGDRKVICGFRRLPHWVMSRTTFEAQRPPYHMATRQMIEEGRFFENSGHENTADLYVQHYSRPRVDHWLRAEYLAQDLASALQLPEETVRQKLKVENTSAKVSDPAFWFTPDQLQKLYEKNPHWAERERALYGDVLRL